MLRCRQVESSDPAFWTRLGKLYAAVVFKPKIEPKPEAVARVNEFFKKAAAHAQADPALLKESADHDAPSQHSTTALPL